MLTSDKILSLVSKDKKLSNSFIGVYPIDKLPHLKPPVGTGRRRKPITLIVNTDTENLDGQHWLAVFIDHENNVGEVFDSFAQIPPSRHWGPGSLDQNWLG